MVAKSGSGVGREWLSAGVRVRTSRAAVLGVRATDTHAEGTQQPTTTTIRAVVAGLPHTHGDACDYLGALQRALNTGSVPTPARHGTLAKRLWGWEPTVAGKAVWSV